MINFLLKIITRPAFEVVTFLASLILDNYFSISRDKRKEFNAIAIPISIRLLSQLDLLKRGGFANPFHFVTIDDFNVLGLHLSKRIASKYKKDLDHYKQCAEHVVTGLLVAG